MKLNGLIGVAALLLASAGAQATIIGVAVKDFGSSAQVGSTNTNGSINFFAPLSGTETYGVDGGGLSSDSCYYPRTCTGGTLNMFLRFSPVLTTDGILSLYFKDLDLSGVNDPDFFFESILLADENGKTLFAIDSVADALADPNILILADHKIQVLLSFVDVISNPFYLRLAFSTSFGPNTPRGWYGNTYETMLATLTQLTPLRVPEPTTLSLLGAGLLAAGLAGRRRKCARRA